ncbi:MAG: hypothetical protein ACRDZO_00920 [Egibacteraceae bacterium]
MQQPTQLRATAVEFVAAALALCEAADLEMPVMLLRDALDRLNVGLVSAQAQLPPHAEAAAGHDGLFTSM